MNKKTKICVAVISLLLIVLMATSCFPVPVPTPSDAGSNTAATEEPIESASSAPDETPAPEKSQMPEYAAGTLTDTGYSSEYLGLQWTIPEGSDLIMTTQEELNTLIETSGTGEMEIEHSYEMMASTAAGNPNMLVMTEKLPLANMSIEQYVQAAMPNITAINESTWDETTQAATIAGIGFIKAPTVLNHEDELTINQDYYFAKVHDRVLSLILTYTESTAEQTQTILDAFEPYAAK